MMVLFAGTCWYGGTRSRSRSSLPQHLFFFRQLAVLLVLGLCPPLNVDAETYFTGIFVEGAQITKYQNQSNLQTDHRFRLTDAAGNKSVSVNGMGLQWRQQFDNSIFLGFRGTWHQNDNLVVEDLTQGTQYSAQWADTEAMANIGLQFDLGNFKLGVAGESGQTHVKLQLQESSQPSALRPSRAEQDLFTGETLDIRGNLAYLRWGPSGDKGLRWELGTYWHQVNARSSTTGQSQAVDTAIEGNFLRDYKKQGTYLQIDGPFAADSFLYIVGPIFVIVALLI